MYKATVGAWGTGSVIRPDGTTMCDLEDGQEAIKVANALNLAHYVGQIANDMRGREVGHG